MKTLTSDEVSEEFLASLDEDQTISDNRPGVRGVSERQSATAPSTSGLLESTMISRQQWYPVKGEEILSTEEDKLMSNCGREAMQPRLRPNVTAPQKCLHKTP
ncbi:predicted protein [Verticillium alfalfae VaMs.102]|uniref:Predicted protein n=1 Tax=Verticillium alfalfae (strain VaMs.102 / ATCC MYA-4576 / FGSC 10136) TaxID=526221 RepID=C9SWL5_VERA1|nr:predicted protein [Verticillium alfalfae VaMs.102]EEY23180.1 predicted protein [Verticillium alfalfae VaMs.102]